MIKRFLFLGLASSLTLAAATAQAQATLITSPYTQSFNSLAGGLPAGFTVYTGASAASLGTAATLTTATTAWNNTSGGFKNFASATGAGLGAGSSSTAQSANPDRALGVRQTGAFGDPGAAFVFQVANTTGKADFQLSYKLQSLDEASPRITSWQVSYSIGATPGTFTNIGPVVTTGDLSFSSTPVTVDFAQALDDKTTPVWIRIATLTASTNGGNRPTSGIDDFALTWTTITPTTPRLTVTPTALDFAGQNINTASTAQTYSLTGANLTAATTLTATGPFTISKDNATYGTTVSYTPAELAAAQTVYVRFTPTATGPATGTITHTSAGASPRTVALTGTGKDPNQTLFDFANCSSSTAISDGWTQYSVTGPQTWACTTFGRDPNAPTGTAAAPYGVQMNGYAGGNVANEDWLISPAFNLTAYNYPLFSFWSRTAFNGPALKLRVSTNYAGTGDPSLATWTDLYMQFPSVGSDTWTQMPAVNLSAYKQANVYVAFVYTSSTSAAARWSLDDIAVTNSATPPAPTAFTDQSVIAFGYQPVNTSGDRTLSVAANDLTGPVTLTTSNPLFTLSKDGVTFANTLTLTQTEVNAQSKAVTVRFSPTTASTSYSASLAIATPGTTVPSVDLTGDTYDTANTLELVNWNIEWFGSTTSGQGPTDKNIQQTNVLAGLTALKADVFALEEVVDTVRFRNIVAQLSANLGVPYAYKISQFGSYADDTRDTDYPGAQKLAFIYRTDIVKPTAFLGLLRCAQVPGCAGYTPWASGRFPYMMSADVTLNGVTKPVNFIVIHAKANATTTSANDYARRKAGAQLLKDLLDTTYPTGNNVIVGDYNDVLNGTIASGTPAVSSYDTFVSDANYVPISLPLAQAGLQSTVSYKTVIDNVIANRSMANYYLNGTAAIRTDVAAAISNYANTTSDHYPVFTRYAFSFPNLVVNTLNQTVTNGTYNDVTVTGTGLGALQGPLVVNGTLTVQAGGRLDTNCQPITGNGTFTVASGASLGICDAAGIATTGNTGAVQVLGTRSFSPDATYIYNGTTTQVTGAGLPSQVRGFTTNNVNDVTLSQPLAVAQVLTVASSGNVQLNNQALTLRSDASTTALVVNSGLGEVLGNTATAQRYLNGSLSAGPGYRQLAAPVRGSTVDNLRTASFAPVVNAAYNTSATPATIQPFPTVYGYNESRLTTVTSNYSAFDKGWYSPTSLTDELTVGKGYTVNLAANQAVSFVGTLNNGTYPQTLTRQDQTANGGWQLVGNPYPAPLDWRQVAAADRTNLESAIYVSQSTGQYANQYRSYVNGVGNPILPLGQGFFVRVAQGTSSASLTMRNVQRVTDFATQVSVQRTAETRPRLNLTLGTAAGSLDELYLYAESGATTSFDAQQDAAKLPNSTGLNLAALTPDGQPLSIQGLAALAGRVALRVQVPAAGTYTLTAAELLNLPAGTQPVLEDALTGQRTPLIVAGSTYSFTVATGASADGRFWLNLDGASPVATPSALQTALTVYPNPTHDGQATLLVPAGTAAGQVQVLDALGRLVRQQALGTAGSTTLKLAGLPAGVYTLRVLAGSEQATHRLTLN